MIRGSCLCGGVKYRITGQLSDARYCHCSMCRKAHGSAFRARTTVKAADFPSKVTLVACVKLTPVIVTTVPTGPLVGLKLLICGVTRNFLMLVSVTPEVVTFTNPVVAPAGTLVVR